uniref:Uncharacterized protein n=1 Tax=viral metagenome TaxID=1070528 RepID=A0A6H1ZBJ2_9ZZZZ
MSLSSERRNDIGVKVSITALTILISALVAVFLVGTYKKAETNTGTLSTHGERITSNTKSIEYVGKEILEFKVEQRTFNNKLDGKIDKILDAR